MTAGSADLQKLFGNDYEKLPCADTGLLGPLKRSPEYRAMRRQGSGPTPLDTWRFDGLHYFLFPMVPQKDDMEAYALFTMRWEDDGPVAALIMTPQPDKKQVRVIDIRQPEVVQQLALSAE